MKSNVPKEKFKTIMNREKLMNLGPEGCQACGKPFTLGDPVVLACGAWNGPPKLIHENEAIFDPNHAIFFERKYFYAGKVEAC